ncbi:MAG: type IV pili twitching motility protein PilT [Dictyoglomus sp. NZ13-RE01]|nr:MAG: type IV pili twitching motility protein PilT [Dictyoglomus sp. NZ13-RE01]
MENRLERILQRALDLKASDIHLKVGAPPALRVLGDITFLEDEYPITTEELKTMIFPFIKPQFIKVFEENGELDFAFEMERKVRLRGNLYLQRGTLALALRIIPLQVPSFEELNLPLTIQNLVSKKSGLILVTGPAGSGKSTTLAAMIDFLNMNYKLKIITIEDPIEYIFKDKNSFITQREIRLDTKSYSTALKMALREDPNVIMVGELRDLETISVALQAAETGHLVLSTIHTTDTTITIERIIDSFPPHQQHQVRIQISNVLQGIISQRLLKRKDRKGLIPACEILVGTLAVRKAIREERTNEIPKIIEASKVDGMQSFNQHLAELYFNKLISDEEALNASPSPQDLKLLLRGITQS